MAVISRLKAYIDIPFVADKSWQMTPQWQRFFTDFVADTTVLPSNNGLIAKTGATTVAGRTISAASTRITITDGDGVSGNPSIDVTEAAVDHDSLLNYLANEHIDWTSTSSNFSTSGTVATGALTVTGNASASGTFTATGAITGASVTATGAVNGATVAATGAVTGASVAVTGAATSATVAATGAITGASIAVTGAATSATVETTGTTTSGGLLSADAGAAVTGNITVTGTVDGRDVAADGTKLDGIETSADVTDETNVTAAFPISDATSLVKDPGDGTKQIRLDAGSISTSTTRVITMPDQNIDLTPNTGDFAGLVNPSFSANILVADDIQHVGDTDNKIAFGTDTQDIQTGGSSRLDVNNSGVRLGAANARVTTVLDEDTMSSDSATALATQQSIKAYADAIDDDMGLVLVSTATASSSSSLDFTGLDSTYAGYVFRIVNLVPGTNAVALYLRVGTGGTPTYQSGASDYSYASDVVVVHTAGNFNPTSAASNHILCTYNTASTAAGASLSGTMAVYDPSNSSTYTKMNGDMLVDKSSGSELEHLDIGAKYNSTTAVTAIRFLFSSGNIASGTIYMYGMKK